jgi:hypothetical protein
MKSTQAHRLVIAIILAIPAFGRAEVNIPAIGQPSPFYGAAGSGVKLETSAEPIEVGPNEFLTFTLRISRLDNAGEVRRPELAEIDAFRDFEIEDVAEPGADSAGTRTFRYRLRPRRANIRAIPGLAIAYYDPNLPQPPDRPDFPFRKARAEAIAIHIRKSEAPPVRVIPLDVPDFAASPAVDASVKIPGWAWWLAIVVPPVLAVGACIVWQIRNPVGARLARKRRSRAARSALKSLHGLSRQSNADPAAVVVCLAAYLAERHNLPGLYLTPGELKNRMAEAGVDTATIEECQGFWRAADAVRFAPTPLVSHEALIADAERLIRRQEGEA